MKLELTGITPLLMHNVRLVDPDDPYTKAIGRLTAKRTNKTDEDRAEIAKLEFSGGLYHSDKVGPYLPAANIFRSLQKAATVTKEGKKIERGFIPLADACPLEYDGPRDIDTLYGDGATQYVDRRAVGVGMKKVMRVRPIFPEWSCSLEFELDDEVLDPDVFLQIATSAGRREGLGDYRRFYGKFAAAVIA